MIELCVLKELKNALDLLLEVRSMSGSEKQIEYIDAALNCVEEAVEKLIGYKVDDDNIKTGG